MWMYKDRAIKSLEDIDNSDLVVGFVYRITEMDEKGNALKSYIGKKSLRSSRKTRISPTEKAKTKTRFTFKRTVKESNWLKYWGSCKPLQEQIKLRGEQFFKREILEFCCSSKYLTFCELEYQIKENVLRTDSYNGNIMSRYFARDMENCQF